jgi:membrane protein implicated in regulation of membrane protease activity
MDWNASILWWVAAGLLVALELATGTFYLLMLGVGALAGGSAALLGVDLNVQQIVAALVGGGAVALWHWVFRPRSVSVPDRANPDVHLDVGQRVQVMAWGVDGATHVDYRGARWAARYAGSGSPSAGLHIIRAIDGNELQLDRSTH